MKNPADFIASFFYVGHSPVMPGTIGALAGLLVYYVVKDNIVLYGFSIVFLFALGAIFSAEAEKIYKKKDAKAIVIDEVCGMLLTLYLLPYRVMVVIVGFIVYRFFDIVKPPPVRRVERLVGSWGVMLDDVIAAIYTNIILQVLVRVLHIFG